MRRNLTSALPRRRRADPMGAFDALPAEARRWLAEARLPWSPQSVRRIWLSALARSRGDRQQALEALARAEARTLARDAAQVWGPSYPGGWDRPIPGDPGRG